MSDYRANRPDENPFVSPRSLEAAEPAVVDDDPYRAELGALVGHKAPYYLSRWDRGSGGYGFNWPAFLLGAIWMAYRKMYRVAAIFLGIILAITFADIVIFNLWLKEEMPTAMDRIIDLAVALGAGFLANGLYLKHAQRAIAWAHAKEPNDAARLSLLRRRGGTSWLAVLVMLFVMLGFIFVAIVAYEVTAPRTSQDLSRVTAPSRAP